MADYFADNFNTYNRDDWLTSTWSSQGSEWLYTSWRDNKVDHNAKNGTVTLNLTDQNDRGKDYTGAEIQTKDFFHFGIFEVKMQASGEDGVNSNFFTYSGEVHGNVKNEIDFEFLGKDPTKVWTSYHSPVANGFGKNGPVGERGEWVDLGFDSSKGMHTYRIEWLPDSIRWYADDKLLRVVEAPEGMTGADIGIPEHPGKMYMNIWAGVPQWLGNTDRDFKETSAVYDSVKYLSWDHPDAKSLGDGGNGSQTAAENVAPQVTVDPIALEYEDADKAPAQKTTDAPKQAAQIEPSAASDITYDRKGGNGNDDLKGSAGEDKIAGGGGNDSIVGRGGDDVLDGGSGSDRLWGGAGNDELIYVAAENVGARDVYVGSTGNDTLTLYLTNEMAQRSDVIAEIAEFQAFLADNADPSSFGGAQFTFDTLGLTVKSIETLDIVVTGDDQGGAKLAAELVKSAYDKALANITPTVEKSASLAQAQAAPEPGQINTEDGDLPTYAVTGSAGNDMHRGNAKSESYNGGEGNDKILSRGGNDVVDGGAGSDFVKAGAGNDRLVYVAAENEGASDRYQGSAGFDTLSLYLTQAEVDALNIDDDISAFQAFAARNYDLGRNGGERFNFDSINLEVQSVEEIELIVYDGY